jgi:hypothetical protein
MSLAEAAGFAEKEERKIDGRILFAIAFWSILSFSLYSAGSSDERAREKALSFFIF